MAPNEKVAFREKVEFTLKNTVKVTFLAKSLQREDQNTIILHLAVLSEVAWEIDLFDYTFSPKFRNHEKHGFGHEWGRGSKFSGFDKSIRRGIARSIYLNYSRGLNQGFLNYFR